MMDHGRRCGRILSSGFSWAACTLMACNLVPAAAPPTEITIDRLSQEDLEVTMLVGQMLVLRLPPAPITSYRWIIDHKSGSSVLLSDSGKFEGVEGPAPGAKSRLTFRFRALSPGCDVFEASYVAGPRSSAANAMDRFRLQICVAAADR